VAKIHALIAAAGRGTRAGLPYPKTLFPIQGHPILLRILELVAPYDHSPTIIVSPEGEKAIGECLAQQKRRAHLVQQPAPRGMGDAVLCFADSPVANRAEQILLIWGDVPFIQQSTIESLVHEHIVHGHDFTFATRLVDSAYTLVSRDEQGRVTSVIESREVGIQKPQAGERDIGLFIFKRQLVMDWLSRDLPRKFGRITGEHGFLYVIGHLAQAGFDVTALPIATELDLVSLNSMKDIDAYL
jgi:bifunctional UDP-N-acetylglucosamine pyrophosphorylase/glucosamine-1-phosphate N-acetyltransferase